MFQAEELINLIKELIGNKQGGEQKSILIALDGRCAAGKTTLAAHLGSAVDGTVFHMDDYFLRPFQRTRERLDTPGGNVDYERFLEEILRPLVGGAGEISYRPYNCQRQELEEAVVTQVGPVVIVEGSYSCHPELWDFYDLHVFVDIAPQDQMKRILHRDGEAKAEKFRDKWIPLEEQYFEECHIREKCEIYMTTAGG